MYFVFILMFSLSSFGATTAEIEKAKQSIKTLIRPILMGQSNKNHSNLKNFRIDRCEKHKINWSDILMMRKAIEVRYSYAVGCDIQGTITPKLLQTFPAKLNLRNLEDFKQIDTENKITASLEMKPILNLEMRQGLLQGSKGIVKFEADYQIQINPISDTEPVQKNLGGEIRITEIYGAKTNIREKIRVQ